MYATSPRNQRTQVLPTSFNVSTSLSGPGTEWRGGFKNVDLALAALENVARTTYDALAQCEFKR